MPTTIIVLDETTSGSVTNQIEILIADEQITVRELIRSRVFQEVKDYNARLAQQPDAPFSGLVVPGEAEAQLNGPREKKFIDWQRQFERATAAFRRGQILILVDERQLDELDEEIALNSKSTVSFLRLTPLTGG